MVLFKCTKKYVIIYVQLSKYFRLYATSNKNMWRPCNIRKISGRLYIPFFYGRHMFLFVVAYNRKYFDSRKKLIGKCVSKKIF